MISNTIKSYSYIYILCDIVNCPCSNLNRIMSSKSLSTDDSESFKILVATDIHLGFEEKNLERGKITLYYSYFYYNILKYTLGLSSYSLHPLSLCVYYKNIKFIQVIFGAEFKRASSLVLFKPFVQLIFLCTVFTLFSNTQ